MPDIDKEQLRQEINKFRDEAALVTRKDQYAAALRHLSRLKLFKDENNNAIFVLQNMGGELEPAYDDAKIIMGGKGINLTERHLKSGAKAIVISEKDFKDIAVKTSGEMAGVKAIYDKIKEPFDGDDNKLKNALGVEKRYIISEDFNLISAAITAARYFPVGVPNISGSKYVEGAPEKATGGYAKLHKLEKHFLFVKKARFPDESSSEPGFRYEGNVPIDKLTEYTDGTMADFFRPLDVDFATDVGKKEPILVVGTDDAGGFPRRIILSFMPYSDKPGFRLEMSADAFLYLAACHDLKIETKLADTGLIARFAEVKQARERELGRTT